MVSVLASPFVSGGNNFDIKNLKPAVNINNMTPETLMKNIFTFANILSQAGSDVVEKWNNTSFRNALNWADYCVKVRYT